MYLRISLWPLLLIFPLFFFFFFFFYTCCFHLEHRTSVKRFVSLQFHNLRHSVGLLERGISPSQGSYLFFIYLVCEAIGTAATPGLLCQPRVIVKMIVEKQVECRSAGGTEVLEENLPQRHFCLSQNPSWSDPGLNPGRRGGKQATNHLSYGAVLRQLPNTNTE
jgi:hypothetical protein